MIAARIPSSIVAVVRFAVPPATRGCSRLRLLSLEKENGAVSEVEVDEVLRLCGIGLAY